MKKILSVLILFGLLCALVSPADAEKINGSLTLEGGLNHCGSLVGTDSYACSITPSITGYSAGTIYSFKADVANTGAATINYNGKGAKTIKKAVGGVTTDLADNDIRAGQYVILQYDGTNMQMQSTLGNGSGGSSSSLVDGTTLAGKILATAIVAPATPSSGVGSIYVDSTSKNLSVKDDAGVVKHGVQTKASTSNQFLTAIADDGTVTAAQPSFANISGTATPAQGGTGLTSGTSGGVPYFSGSTTIASSAALTASAPVIGGGPGAAPTVGSRSGNTTVFVTTTGAQTSGRCVEIDASGNHIQSAAGCGGGGSGGLTTTAAKTSNYTAVSGDFVPCDATSGGFTITLPSAGSATAVVVVKKIDSSANACTVSRAGSDTIDGATTQVLSTQYTAVGFQANGATSWWAYGLLPTLFAPIRLRARARRRFSKEGFMRPLRLIAAALIAALTFSMLAPVAEAALIQRMAIYDSTLTNAVGVTSNRLDTNATQSGNWTARLADSAGTGWTLTTASDGRAGMPVWVQNPTAAGTGADSASTARVITTNDFLSTMSAQGRVASAGSNAGNPLKTGGPFNTTQPTVTTGQIVDSQYTARGAAIVATGVDPFVVSLPSGASTAAKQPALGTAGTASADFISTQGGAGMTPLLIQPQAVTTGGASECYVSSAASTNATNCKASAGNIYGYDLINTTGTLYYLRMYNASGTPTCSSATGYTRSIPIPANTAGSGAVVDYGVGVSYGTGIAFCLTAGGSSTDNTSAATGVYVTVRYK